MKIRVPCLIILFGFLYFAAFSQEFRRFSIGAGAGVTTNSSDLQTSDKKKMVWAAADFYLTKYIQGGFEIAKGKLSGKEDNFTGRYFLNDYKSLTFLGKVHLGQFISEARRSPYNGGSGFLVNAIRGIYIGSGGGLLVSAQEKIQRVPVNSDWEYLYRGQNNNKELFIPGTAGIDWFAGKQARIIVSFQYQVNFVLGDNMDGYLISGSKNDLYSTFGIGVKYAFGRLRYH